MTKYNVHNRGNFPLKFGRSFYHCSQNSLEIVQWIYDITAFVWPPLIYVHPSFSGNFAEGRSRKVGEIDTRCSSVKMFSSIRLIHNYLPCSPPCLLTGVFIFVNGFYRRYIFASSRCLDSDCQLMALL